MINKVYGARVAKSNEHPKFGRRALNAKCLGDGQDGCGYYPDISCEECRYGQWGGRKHPESAHEK